VVVFLSATYAHLLFHSRDRRRVWRALPGEFLAEVWAVLLWPWFALLGSRHEGAARGLRPVILLHGYGMNRMSFYWLGRSLARRGLGPLCAMSYMTLRSVRHSAQRLARFVERVCEDEGASAVDLVCHSLGGIVARYYADVLGGAARVRRIITIGTPHQGTMSAHMALDQGAFDLRPKSALLTQLAGKTNVSVTSIWSRADNVIMPPENASFGADDVVFEDLGHMALLLSPRVADVVASLLSAEQRSDALARPALLAAPSDPDPFGRPSTSLN
jgi:triacylglycerol esterase/lipase EstA (alpha/beta hydrolase family)